VSPRHQKPTGQPVALEMAGLAMTIAMRLRAFAVTGLESFRLIAGCAEG
jgi:hypothetical protein